MALSQIIMYVLLAIAAAIGNNMQEVPVNEIVLKSRNVFDYFQWNPRHILSARNLNYLGSVGSKAYFMENSVLRSWYDAKNFAASLNMSLIGFPDYYEDPSVYYFFKNLTTAQLPIGSYWTSGIENMNLHPRDKYKWDNNNENYTYHGFQFQLDSLSCILYRLYSNSVSLVGESCRTRLSGVLLQS